MIKTCARCGHEFADFGRAKYCSDKCRHEATLERKRASYERLKKPSSAPNNFETTELVCQECGKKFTGFAKRKYCSEKCRRQNQRELENIRRRNNRRREIAQRKFDKTAGKPVKTLDDWALEARECNLDYGTYRALIASGKTFEQLKAEQRSPQFHSHCRHTYGF